MGTKHKHYDVIVAWAAGEEVEYLEEGVWYPMQPLVPPYYENNQYRIKPKRVNKEGWVNIYKATEHWHIGVAHITNAYTTKEEALADRRYDIEPTDTIRIEWEEEA